MRVAFLCKRRYMSKDVILDRYARLYEIPRQLARLGHDVHAWCLAYGTDPDGEWRHEAQPGSLFWTGRSLGTTRLPALLAYPRWLEHAVAQFKPDVIIGASDMPHVVLASRIAKRLSLPWVADLYDNFEGFGQARIPGLVPLFRRAVRKADLVLTTSEPLSDLIVEEYRACGKVLAMPSTIDSTLFHPRDKLATRRSLGLPECAKLVGTAGGLYADKGVDALYTAWTRLAEHHTDLHLVLAGPTDPKLPPPTDDRVHALGNLPHTRVADLFAALDVGVIYLRDTAFGRYCFPQKAYEMFACDLPVAAACVGVMESLLADVPSALYRPDDPEDLARAISTLLAHPARPDVQVRDWATVIGEVEPLIAGLANPPRVRA